MPTMRLGLISLDYQISEKLELLYLPLIKLNGVGGTKLALLPVISEVRFMQYLLALRLVHYERSAKLVSETSNC